MAASEAPPAVVIFLLLGALLLGCGDWSKEIGKGCRLVRVSGGQVLLAGPGEVPKVLIDPNVDQYAAVGNWVVGHVSRPELPPEDTVDSVPGFFIVSCESGEVLEGLDRTDWLAELRTRSLGQPDLKKPSRFGSG